MTDTDTWAGPLDPDERIIWQGRPQGQFRFTFKNPFGPIFFALLIVYTLYLFFSNLSAAGFLAAAYVVGFGFYYFVFQHVLDARKRRGTSYALTNTRALICHETSDGPTYSSFPITPDTAIKLEDKAMGSVWFWYAPDQRILSQKRYFPLGFEQLEHPPAVYDLLRTIQRGDA